MASRAANQERARWRDQCRHALSDHIRESQRCEPRGMLKSSFNPIAESRLGLLIDPAEVRLIPHQSDPYTWSYMPHRRHLFRKHISKHNLGAYREICAEVGRSFEAVARDAPVVYNYPSQRENSADQGSSRGTVTETREADELRRDQIV